MKATITEFHEDGRVKKVKEIVPKKYTSTCGHYQESAFWDAWQQANLKEYEVVDESIYQKASRISKTKYNNFENREVGKEFCQTQYYNGYVDGAQQSHPFNKDFVIGFMNWQKYGDVEKTIAQYEAFGKLNPSDDDLIQIYINRGLGEECEIEIIDDTHCKIVKP